MLPLSSKIIIGSLRDKVELLWQHTHTPVPAVPALLTYSDAGELAPPSWAFDSSPRCSCCSPSPSPFFRGNPWHPSSTGPLRSLWVMGYDLVDAAGTL